jgi:cytochrome c oxidase subunit II
MTGHSLPALAARGLPPPLTDQASDIDRVWNVFFIGALAVAGLVAVLITIVVIRFRRRDDSLPRQVRENIPIEATYTAIPLLIVGGLFALTVVSMWALDQPDDDEADLIVEVTAFQWQWRFDYPESGASVVGTDEVVPELVLPADSTVRFELTSRDVIHSFWITGFRFKRDVFPHQVTTFTVDVGDRTGTFSSTGVCAEFCGVDHTTMRFSVRVVTPPEFEAWALEEGGGGA